MQRYLWLALALTACAKSAKEAAPAKEQPPPPPPPPMAVSPTVGAQSSAGATGGAPGGGTDQGALEQARSNASLGVSADTTAFDPIGSGSERPKDGPTMMRRPVSTQAAIGAVTVDGKPAPSALSQAIKVRVSDVQACYDKAGKADLAGALEISFSVLPTGALASASVESTTLKNMAVESCVIGVLQGIKLAKPLGTTETKARVAISFAAK